MPIKIELNVLANTKSSVEVILNQISKQFPFNVYKQSVQEKISFHFVSKHSLDIVMTKMTVLGKFGCVVGLEDRT